MAPKEEGELVGTGTFRVDVSKMLDKLAQSGYGRVRDAYLALIRCAVLSGAKKATVTARPGGAGLFSSSRDTVEIAWGGRAFDAETIENPYQSLGGLGGPERERTVLLARALLTLTSFGPYKLTVAGAGVSAEVLSVGKHAVDEVENTRGTSVRVEWLDYTGKDDDGGADNLGKHLWKNLRFCPILVHLKEEEKQIGGTLPKGGRALESKGCRGWLRPGKNGVDLYWHGARVETLSGKALPKKVEGFIEFDDFKVDLSAQHVVRDAAFARALGIVGRP